MRCERAKMAIFLWLAPRPALAGSYLFMGGERAEKTRDFERQRAKIGVLSWCTWFCYSYWEHESGTIINGFYDQFWV